MPVQTLEDIEVYVIAEKLADKWCEIISRWKPFAQDTIGKQLIRAIDSFGANIAESYGRYPFTEKINLLYYVRGSLYESKFFVRRAMERKLISESEFTEMMNVLQALAPELNAYIKS